MPRIKALRIKRDLAPNHRAQGHHGGIATGGSTAGLIGATKAVQGLSIVAAGTPGYTAVTTATAVAGGGCVIAAGGAGMGIGWGLDQTVGALISWATGGDSSSLGEWFATTEEGRAIAGHTTGVDPVTSAVGEGDSDAAGAPAEGESESQGSEDGEGDSDAAGAPAEDSGNEDDDDDDDDDKDSKDDKGDQGSKGTTVPPDMDTSTVLGNIFVFGATAVGARHQRAALKQLELKVGGIWGIEGRGNTFDKYIAFDALLGGAMFKSIARGLEARQGKHGYRDVYLMPGIENLNVAAMPNFGLVAPDNPLAVLLSARRSSAIIR